MWRSREARRLYTKFECKYVCWWRFSMAWRKTEPFVVMCLICQYSVLLSYRNGCRYQSRAYITFSIVEFTGLSFALQISAHFFASRMFSANKHLFCGITQLLSIGFLPLSGPPFQLSRNPMLFIPLFFKSLFLLHSFLFFFSLPLILQSSHCLAYLDQR